MSTPISKNNAKKQPENHEESNISEDAENNEETYMGNLLSDCLASSYSSSPKTFQKTSEHLFYFFSRNQ